VVGHLRGKLPVRLVDAAVHEERSKPEGGALQGCVMCAVGYPNRRPPCSACYGLLGVIGDPCAEHQHTRCPCENLEKRLGWSADTSRAEIQCDLAA
jgi:hypothetical protein